MIHVKINEKMFWRNVRSWESETKITNIYRKRGREIYKVVCKLKLLVQLSWQSTSLVMRMSWVRCLSPAQMKEVEYKYDKLKNKFLMWLNIPFHTMCLVYYLKRNGHILEEITDEITFKEFKELSTAKVVCKLKRK